MADIGDVSELERVVGSRPLPMMMKSIDRLDEHCVALLRRSPVGVLGHEVPGGGLRARLVGGAPGFAVPETASRLRLPVPSDAVPGGGAALLVLLPGWRETLRVNGTVEQDHLAVEEAFLHCGKAVIRSGLWAPAPSSGPATVDPPGDAIEDGPALGPAAADFLAGAPFAVVVSHGGDGRADASPKGDPGGVLRMVGPTTVVIADRPGNRRTDTFHNVVDRPDVAVLALAPGGERTLEISGGAAVSTELAQREAMSERGRLPQAVLRIEVARARLADGAALRDAALWDAAHHVGADELPSPACVWRDHIEQQTAGAS